MRKHKSPAPTSTYTGDGLEVIANLSPDTNSAQVLNWVAEWHERGRTLRNQTIALALRRVARQQAASNDNRRGRRAA